MEEYQEQFIYLSIGLLGTALMAFLIDESDIIFILRRIIKGEFLLGLATVIAAIISDTHQNNYRKQRKGQNLK